jgi:hypothetical protein
MILTDESTLTYTRDGATMLDGAEVVGGAECRKCRRRMFLPAGDIGPDVTRDERDFADCVVEQHYANHETSCVG